MTSFNAPLASRPDRRQRGGPMARGRRQAHPARPAASRGLNPVLPALLVAYSCLLPRELTLTIATVDFRPYRLALILVLPLVLSLLSTRRLRFTTLDAMAIGAGAWCIVAMAFTSTIIDTLNAGMGPAMDILLSYLVGRVCLQKPDDFRRFFIAFTPGCALVGLSMAVESILHQQFVRTSFARLLGAPPVFSQSEVRWGLLRALGTFPHPILGGTFLASLLPGALLVAERPRDKVIALMAASCCIFTVSSTSILNFLIGVMLVAVLIMQRFTRAPLMAISAGFATLLIVAVGSLSQGGLMSFVIRYMSINAANGYYRKMIWTFAGAEANNHPIFGIGVRDWIRPSFMVNDTLDAHWLLLTMRYGYPLCIFLLVFIVGSAVTVAVRSGKFTSVRDRNACAAVAMPIFTIVVAGLSVALWEGIWVWLILLSGCAVSMSQSAQATRAARHGSAARVTVGSTRRRPGNRGVARPSSVLT